VPVPRPSVSWMMSPVCSLTRKAWGPLPARSERKMIHLPSAVHVVCVWYGFESLAGSLVSTFSVAPVPASVIVRFSGGKRRPTLGATGGRPALAL